MRDLLTQKERIMLLLRTGPVCGTDLLKYHMPRYAARINELRNDGHTIARRRCERHQHSSTQYEYVLIDPNQLELI